MKIKLLDTYEYDQIHQVLGFTLNLLGLKFTNHQLKESIKAHVDSPSFATVQDILSSYGIQSSVIRKGTYDYEDFQTPFICLIKNERAENNFTLVTKVENGEITFLDAAQNQLRVLKSEIFEQMDEKFILLMDDTDKKDEEAYELNKKKGNQKRLALLAPFILTLGMILFNSIGRNSAIETNSLQKILYLFSFYLGALTAALLIWQEIDSHNPFFKKLCGGERERTTNCDMVLRSKGAKFLHVSWSIWGFSYFFTLFVAHLLFFDQLSTWLCAVASIAAFPYVFYSIYYQFKVLKKWCRLCLLTQLVLVINFGLGLSLPYRLANTIDFKIIGTIALFGLLLVFLSSFVANLLKKAKKGELVEKKWRKLRYDESVFKTLLQQQPRLAVNELGILIGNPNAAIEIIKVCNLYCGPCAVAHQEIAKLMANDDRIKLRIIFNPGGQTDRNTPLTFHFLGIEQQYGTAVFHEALEEWFKSETKDHKELRQKYPVKEDLINYLPKTQMMSQWCHSMNINRTPSFFINGHPLPEEYSFADFKYLF